MQKIYSILSKMLIEKRSGAVGTVISSSNTDFIGRKFIVNEKGELINSELPDTFYSYFEEAVVSVVKSREPKVLPYEQDALKFEVFIDPFHPHPHLIVLGGGHIALPLVKIARVLGYEITVIDDRVSFANPIRFSEADHVICESFDKAIENLTLAPNTYVVVVTRGHKYDKTCLADILNRPQPAYVGMIGSRRKVAAILDELEYEGFDPQKFESVYTPIGLDIGAQTPEEIALSIMAEITMVNHYGDSNGLKSRMEGRNRGR